MKELIELGAVLLIVWAVWYVWRAFFSRKKGGGCCGDCAHCGESCGDWKKRRGNGKEG